MILTIDLALWPLVLTTIAIGYWMGFTKVKGWAVPINTLLGVIAFSFAMVWGLLTVGFSVHSIVTYGIPNGVMVWLGATVLYDFVHEFIKKKEEWLSVWKKVSSLLKMKKKEAK